MIGSAFHIWRRKSELRNSFIETRFPIARLPHPLTRKPQGPPSALLVEHIDQGVATRQAIDAEVTAIEAGDAADTTLVRHPQQRRVGL